MATLTKKLIKAALPEIFIGKDVLISGERVALTSVTFSDTKGDTGIRVAACVYAHLVDTVEAEEVTQRASSISRKITYPSGAWIEIDYRNEQYTVSREHGVGAILEEMAKMILGGFEGCRKFVELESQVTKPFNDCETTPEWWDCNCAENYQHKTTDKDYCPECGFTREDGSDSRIAELPLFARALLKVAGEAVETEEDDEWSQICERKERHRMAQREENLDHCNA